MVDMFNMNFQEFYLWHIRLKRNLIYLHSMDVSNKSENRRKAYHKLNLCLKYLLLRIVTVARAAAETSNSVLTLV